VFSVLCQLSGCALEQAKSELTSTVQGIVSAIEYDAQVNETRIYEQRHHVLIVAIAAGQVVREAFINTRRVRNDVLILGDVGGRKRAHFSQDISARKLVATKTMAQRMLTFPIVDRSSIHTSLGSSGRSPLVDPCLSLVSSLLG
jgi:hypothetical protein